MSVTARGDLREMRDAQHLIALPDVAQLLPYHVGDPPADARVDFVEDERLAWRAGGRQGADGEHDPRELPSRRDARARPQVFPHVGREIAFGHVDTLLGPRGFGDLLLEADFETRAAHGEVPQQVLKPSGKVDRVLPPGLRERPGVLQEFFPSGVRFRLEPSTALTGV